MSTRETPVFAALRTLLQAYHWPTYQLRDLPVLVSLPPASGRSIWCVARDGRMSTAVFALVRTLQQSGHVVLQVTSLTEAIEELERLGLGEGAAIAVAAD